jgi:hypothetical protein
VAIGLAMVADYNYLVTIGFMIVIQIVIIKRQTVLEANGLASCLTCQGWEPRYDGATDSNTQMLMA